MEKPYYEFPAENDPRGNIFCILGEVGNLISPEQYKELCDRIMVKHEAHSYEEAKEIIKEYVNVY